jgi:hypothetical protein
MVSAHASKLLAGPSVGTTVSFSIASDARGIDTIGLLARWCNGKSK